MIVFNFLLFLLIAVGQGFIYWSVNAGSMAVHDSSRRSKDLTIARRLITVAVPDFLCWFPIGLLGLLASNGSPVPGEVNVATAIIVLPVNSALNPFLYTLNTILEKRRRLEERRLQKLLLGRLESGRDVGADDDVCGGSCTETASKIKKNTHQLQHDSLLRLYKSHLRPEKRVSGADCRLDSVDLVRMRGAVNTSVSAMALNC